MHVRRASVRVRPAHERCPQDTTRNTPYNSGAHALEQHPQLLWPVLSRAELAGLKAIELLVRVLGGVLHHEVVGGGGLLQVGPNAHAEIRAEF